jgi:hypothetical protein
MRPDAGRATRLSASARSTGGFDRLLRTRRAICRGSRRPKGRSSSRNDPESGDCRLYTLTFKVTMGLMIDGGNPKTRKSIQFAEFCDYYKLNRMEA